LVVYREETTIFVIDVHFFYDEMVIVTEAISFYDEHSSSLMYSVFVIAYRSVRLPNGVCHVGS
jgi:hypothetical protein